MIPDYIIIDFDSTFITEESLDELAKYKLRDQPDSQTMLNKIKSLTNAGTVSYTHLTLPPILLV